MHSQNSVVSHHSAGKHPSGFQPLFLKGFSSGLQTQAANYCPTGPKQHFRGIQALGPRILLTRLETLKPPNSQWQSTLRYISVHPQKHFSLVQAEHKVTYPPPAYALQLTYKTIISSANGQYLRHALTAQNRFCTKQTVALPFFPLMFCRREEVLLLPPPLLFTASPLI